MAIGTSYDILVYEMLFYPAYDIANRMGIPSVRQFSQPAWNKEAYQVIREQSAFFLTSCKLIDKQMMSRKTSKELHMQGRNLIDSILSDRPALNVVYVTSDFQPMRHTFDEQYLFVGPSIKQENQKEQVPFSNNKRPLIYIHG